MTRRQATPSRAWLLKANDDSLAGDIDQINRNRPSCLQIDPRTDVVASSSSTLDTLTTPPRSIGRRQLPARATHSGVLTISRRSYSTLRPPGLVASMNRATWAHWGCFGRQVIAWRRLTIEGR
jgi:hypothetical protein